jgi:hypothetical protein
MSDARVNLGAVGRFLVCGPGSSESTIPGGSEKQDPPYDCREAG